MIYEALLRPYLALDYHNSHGFTWGLARPHLSCTGRRGTRHGEGNTHHLMLASEEGMRK
jgi:hypothetical protein